MSLKPIFEFKLPHGFFRVYDQKPDFDFFEVHQVHGVEIVDSDQKPISEADGIIASLHSLQTPLAIKTADCLPIVLMNDQEAALLHAGWRGVKDQIYLQSKVLKLKPTFCFIGPHISSSSFEVSPDFRDNFKNYSDLFHKKDSRLFFSLIDTVKRDLFTQFPDLIIEESSIDTYTNPQFHSFRRNKTDQRNYNVISIQ